MGDRRYRDNPDNSIIFSAILSLIVAGVLRNTLFRVAIDNWYMADTSTWHWATAVFWQVVPIILIAGLIFIPVRNFLANHE